MSEIDPLASEDPLRPRNGARFDGASLPRSHTQPAFSKRSSPGGGSSEPQRRDDLDSVRDVSIEALLDRLDKALAAIRSLDEIRPDDPDAADSPTKLR